MDLKEIHEHWESIAEAKGVDLTSTTKTSTIKRLEIAAMSRALTSYLPDVNPVSILEMGCGNGHNLFALSGLFPEAVFEGTDISPNMVSDAEILREASGHHERMTFRVMDVLDMDSDRELSDHYSAVITDRLLINLTSWDLQKRALENLANRVARDGLLLILENYRGVYSAQNSLRQAIGLEPRTPDPTNLFMDEAVFDAYMQSDLGLELVDVDDFGSLHDILLYVLLPSVNEGTVVYDHLLMGAVTNLLENASDLPADAFGSFGQNRLYVYRKQS